jgi:hypothetical protein
MRREPKNLSHKYFNFIVYFTEVLNNKIDISQSSAHCQM